MVRQIAIITSFAVPAKPQLANEFGFPYRKAKVSRMNVQTHEARQRYAPYLAAHPRCRLMPPPPGRPLMAGAPPVVWRSVGSTDMSYVSVNLPPPSLATWNQRLPTDQAVGQQPVILQQLGCQGCPKIQRGLRYAPIEGNLDGHRHGAHDPGLSAKMWQGSAQAPNLVPQQQLAVDQAQSGSLAHGLPYQPFPLPVPRASPEQLLLEIRQGLPGYALNRLVAIEATQRVLSKHLSEMAAIDERMGGLFADRAEMQKQQMSH